MPSIFSRIIAGEIPSYEIAQDEHFYAFLDISPVSKGHTLVVPKVEIDYYFDIPDELLAKMQLFCKKIAQAQKKAFLCERVSVLVMGFEVPHAHIHLIPSDSMADLNFGNKLTFTKEEMLEIALQIKNYL
jgi:histidine triad (HIT) family protein